jgi:predicted DNA-binding transcriptional regulator AlpA
MIAQLGTPAEVAEVLQTTTGNLAQMRYRGDGPKFVRMGRKRVLYRWTDVEQWVNDSVHHRTDD